MSDELKRTDVERVVSEARAKGERPDLRGADMSGADMSWANLSGAILTGADLRDADLRDAILHGADLNGANLRDAILSWADLRDADLIIANLSWANLSGAILRGADLTGANLSGATLSGADLSWADLNGADLSGADLSGANLSGATLSMATLSRAKNIPDYAISVTSILPEGDIIGWKKLVGDTICKLLIPANGLRSNATGRKCRCDKVKVLEIWDGEKSVESGVSKYDDQFVYRVGEWVNATDFDEDRWNECSTGIHFFITRYEAEHY